MSNMIKAYSVRYKEDKRLLDLSEKEEKLNRIRALLGQEAPKDNSFVGGIAAVRLTEEDGTEEETDTEAGVDALFRDDSANAGVMREPTEEEIEEIRQQIRAEIEEERRMILQKAAEDAEDMISQARDSAGLEMERAMKKGHDEGYQKGLSRLNEERKEMERGLEEKERLLREEYEKKETELAPKAVEVVIELLRSLSGVYLKEKQGVISYLVQKALSQSEHSQSYLIRVSPLDYEEVKACADDFRAIFDREISLEISRDSLMQKNECTIETDFGIIDCSLGTQLEGLFEELRLMNL